MQSIIKPRKDELDPGPKCVQTYFNNFRGRYHAIIIILKTIKSKQIFVFLLQSVANKSIMTLMKEVPVLYLVQKITVFR